MTTNLDRWQMSTRLRNALQNAGWTTREAVLAASPGALQRLRNVGQGTVAEFISLQKSLSPGNGSPASLDRNLEMILHTLPNDGAVELRELLKQRGLTSMADVFGTRAGPLFREIQVEPVTQAFYGELFRRVRRHLSGSQKNAKPNPDFTFIAAIDSKLFPFEARRVFRRGERHFQEALRGTLPPLVIRKGYRRLLVRYCALLGARFGVRIPSPKVARLLLVRNVKDLAAVEQLSPTCIRTIDNSGRGAEAQLAAWRRAVLVTHGKGTAVERKPAPDPSRVEREEVREVLQNTPARLGHLLKAKPLPQVLAMVLEARFGQRPPSELVAATDMPALTRMWRRFGDRVECLLRDKGLRSPTEKAAVQMAIKGASLAAIGRAQGLTRERIRQTMNRFLIHFLTDDVVLDCLATLGEAAMKRWIRPTPARLKSVFGCRDGTVGWWVLQKGATALFSLFGTRGVQWFTSGKTTPAPPEIDALLPIHGIVTWAELPAASIEDLIYADLMLSRSPRVAVVEAGRYGERTSYRRVAPEVTPRPGDERKRALRKLLLGRGSRSAEELARCLGKDLRSTRQLLRDTDGFVPCGAGRWGLRENIPLPSSEWRRFVDELLEFLATAPRRKRVHLADVPLSKDFAILLPVHAYSILWMNRSHVRSRLKHFPRDLLFPGTRRIQRRAKPRRSRPRQPPVVECLRVALAKAGRPVSFEELKSLWPGPRPCPSWPTLQRNYIRSWPGIVSFGQRRVGLVEHLPVSGARRQELGAILLAAARKTGRMRFRYLEPGEWFPEEKAFRSLSVLRTVCGETPGLIPDGRFSFLLDPGDGARNGVK